VSGFDSYRVRERADLARWVVVGAFLLLIGAFFHTQVIEHEKFQLRAEKNRLRQIPLVAPRGTIYDRHGRIIAENVPGYAVKLIAPSVASLRAVLRRFQQVVPLDSLQEAEVIARYRRARYQPAVVFGDASFETVARLEERRAALPGLVIQAEPKRLYPAGAAVAHLVGYVGEVTEGDLEAKRFPGTGLGSIVGKAGLERQYDRLLRGSEGIRYIEVNARGRVVRENVMSASLAPTPGTPIRTTIDLDLQRFIDSIWPPGVRGSMVALSPKGEVLALYSAPSYDPNEFVGGIPPKLWRQLNTDSARPLYNRAIQATYPPASPFKLATAAMGLKRGIITPESHMPLACTGGFRLGNRVFKCWKKEGHGNLDLIGAVAKSCDVYFYQLGLRLGLNTIWEEGVEMGMGSRTGIDLGSERSPIYPASTAYFNRVYGPRGWSPPATTLNYSIGQGENTQTVINMVSFYQALAGDGLKMPPYLVQPNDTVKPRSLGLTPQQLEDLRLSMIAVVEQGTAARSRRVNLRIAGKTGTAQNPHGDDHGWFIGFAPADKPEIIIGSVMEFFKHGSDVAPYVSRALSRYVIGPEPPPVPKPADSLARAIGARPPRDAVARFAPIAVDSAPPPPVLVDSAKGRPR
jgi:penicillin-binding protein 2